jgi:uncharacterized heparinase superfamily protein
MAGAALSESEPDEIPVGRRLVRAQSDTGQSLADRLLEQVNKLTWRTPLYALRLRGRYPLKLLAVPDDPLPGDAEAGKTMLAGEIRWHGQSMALAAIDFSGDALHPRFEARLQRFDFLRDLAAAGPRQLVAPVAERLTRQWLATNADKVAEPAWRPDLWGWRILNWSFHAPLILSSTDLVYRSAVLNGLARGARHLDRNADRAPAGLPRIAAWAGVVAAGLLIAGGNPRRGFGEAGLARALAAGMSSDGGIICRTPHGQAELVLLLAMLSRVYLARRTEPPAALSAALQRAVPPLLGVMLSDGGLSSWQGSPPMDAASLKALLDASGIRTRPLRHVREWGYNRIASGQTVLVFDAAPPPAHRVASGGCASTLAFELSDGPNRLIVNCGGAHAGGLPPGLSDALRTTAAHSTLVLGDTNSTAILSDGALGKGVSEVDLEREDGEQGSRIEGVHDGYVKRFGLKHRRSLLLGADGRELRGEDVLLPARARQKPMTAGFALRFHLAPGVEATPTADGMGALMRIDKGPLWQFRCRGGTLEIEQSLWIGPEGDIHRTSQLVVAGEAPPGGASVSWALKRAG